MEDVCGCMSPVEIFFWFLVLFFVFQIFIRIVRRIWHHPAPAFFGRVLDSGYRRRIQPAGLLLSQSGIRPGMRVLEIGCGSGAYTTFAARAVGPEGSVIGFDIQEGMLQQLLVKRSRLEYGDIQNLDLVRGNALQLPFCNETFDAVYMVTVLQEIPDPHAALVEVNRVLKPGGYLGVSELLIDPDYPLKSTTIRMGEKAGFTLDAAEGGFFTYTVRFKK
jgi:ubiquinone/menaquinone biosynthesis C-methylase UbiE